jgi:hypothetical protein
MEKNNEIKKFKVATIVLSVVVLALLVALIFTSVKVKTIVVEKDKAGEVSTELKGELDSLMNQHELIKKEYAAMSGKLTEKDSLIAANAEEINKLIAVNADYRKIKKKLDLLRNMTQGYVQKIDSLYRVNSVLTNENSRFRADIDKYKETTTTLETDKKNLTEKVTSAAKLKAYGISAKAVKLKSKGAKEEVVDKASRAERFKVSFTLSENNVAAAGSKTIYCRIARPDGKVLILGEDDANSFVSGGNRLQFSLKKEIQYDNSSQNVTLNWDIKNEKEEAVKGRYYVILYVDGYQIGEGSFDLK